MTTWLTCGRVVCCRMDRAAQHALEIDAKDKHHAQGLDDRMQQMRNGSGGIGYHPGIETIDNTYVPSDLLISSSHMGRGSGFR